MLFTPIARGRVHTVQLLEDFVSKGTAPAGSPDWPLPISWSPVVHTRLNSRQFYTKKNPL